MLCRLSRRHLWRSILPSTVALAEPSDSMLHGNTCEVRDGDRPPSRFVERERERNAPVRKPHYPWFVVVGVAWFALFWQWHLRALGL